MLLMRPLNVTLPWIFGYLQTAYHLNKKLHICIWLIAQRGLIYFDFLGFSNK